MSYKSMLEAENNQLKKENERLKKGYNDFKSFSKGALVKMEQLEADLAMWKGMFEAMINKQTNYNGVDYCADIPSCLRIGGQRAECHECLTDHYKAEYERSVKDDNSDNK
jgi:hypothetical protein